MESPKNHSLISFVFEINQTIQTTNHQRPCTTTQEIKKAHSNCQSFSCPDLVSFPALGQIDPQIPLLVCHSVNFFKFRSCDYTPPRKQSFNDFSAFYLSRYTWPPPTVHQAKGRTRKTKWRPHSPARSRAAPREGRRARARKKLTPEHGPEIENPHSL